MMEPKGLPDLVVKLKEILLGRQESSPRGEDDDTKQSEQVLHFVRHEEPEEKGS